MNYAIETLEIELARLRRVLRRLDEFSLSEVGGQDGRWHMKMLIENRMSTLTAAIAVLAGESHDSAAPAGDSHS
ncbi:MAG TPA: hypothetical protein VFR81_04270 [Longimicrobium sp.]|nr:hypothetical protein [Longimicrobium sp.]